LSNPIETALEWAAQLALGLAVLRKNKKQKDKGRAKSNRVWRQWYKSCKVREVVSIITEAAHLTSYCRDDSVLHAKAIGWAINEWLYDELNPCYDRKPKYGIINPPARASKHIGRPRWAQENQLR
jgi:hypothetical protein